MTDDERRYTYVNQLDGSKHRPDNRLQKAENYDNACGWKIRRTLHLFLRRTLPSKKTSLDINRIESLSHIKFLLLHSLLSFGFCSAQKNELGRENNNDLLLKEPPDVGVVVVVYVGNRCNVLRCNKQQQQQQQ